MYRGDKEEDPEQIRGVHRVLEGAVLTYSYWTQRVFSFQQALDVFYQSCW